MRKALALYWQTVRMVMRIARITHDELRNSRKLQCVIARAVLVAHLMSIGFAECDIVRISGMSQQRVNSLKNARHHHTSLMARSLRRDLAQAMRRYEETSQEDCND